MGIAVSYNGVSFDGASTIAELSIIDHIKKIKRLMNHLTKVRSDAEIFKRNPKKGINKFQYS